MSTVNLLFALIAQEGAKLEGFMWRLGTKNKRNILMRRFGLQNNVVHMHCLWNNVCRMMSNNNVFVQSQSPNKVLLLGLWLILFFAQSEGWTRSCFTTRNCMWSLLYESSVASFEVELDSLRKLAIFSSSLLEEITTLWGGFFAFGRRLLHEGDLGTLGSALTSRLCALRGGDGGGISTAMLWVLLPMGGTAVLVGSLWFWMMYPILQG